MVRIALRVLLALGAVLEVIDCFDAFGWDCYGVVIEYWLRA